jgi:hypothetical protein
MESVTERLGASYFHIPLPPPPQKVAVLSGISTLSFSSLYRDTHSETYNHKLKYGA